MSDPFLAQIKLMTSNRPPPRGYAFCDGQFLDVNQNMALYALLGITYGGDGRINFALPDMRGRTPVHKGASSSLGLKGGVESVTLTTDEMPKHKHFFNASAEYGVSDVAPAGNFLANLGAIHEYVRTPKKGLVAGNEGIISSEGGTSSHSNMQPFLTISFCIALQGLFPPRS